MNRTGDVNLITTNEFTTFQIYERDYGFDCGRDGCFVTACKVLVYALLSPILFIWWMIDRCCLRSTALPDRVVQIATTAAASTRSQVATTAAVSSRSQVATTAAVSSRPVEPQQPTSANPPQTSRTSEAPQGTMPAAIIEDWLNQIREATRGVENSIHQLWVRAFRIVSASPEESASAITELANTLGPQMLEVFHAALNQSVRSNQYQMINTKNQERLRVLERCLPPLTTLLEGIGRMNPSSEALLTAMQRLQAVAGQARSCISSIQQELRRLGGTTLATTPEGMSDRLRTAVEPIERRCRDISDRITQDTTQGPILATLEERRSRCQAARASLRELEESDRFITESVDVLFGLLNQSNPPEALTSVVRTNWALTGLQPKCKRAIANLRAEIEAASHLDSPSATPVTTPSRPHTSQTSTTTTASATTTATAAVTAPAAPIATSASTSATSTRVTAPSRPHTSQTSTTTTATVAVTAPAAPIATSASTSATPTPVTTPSRPHTSQTSTTTTASAAVTAPAAPIATSASTSATSTRVTAPSRPHTSQTSATATATAAVTAPVTTTHVTPPSAPTITPAEAVAQANTLSIQIRDILRTLQNQAAVGDIAPSDLIPVFQESLQTLGQYQTTLDTLNTNPHGVGARIQEVIAQCRSASADLQHLIGVATREAPTRTNNVVQAERASRAKNRAQEISNAVGRIIESFNRAPRKNASTIQQHLTELNTVLSTAMDAKQRADVARVRAEIDGEIRSIRAALETTHGKVESLNGRIPHDQRVNIPLAPPLVTSPPSTPSRRTTDITSATMSHLISATASHITTTTTPVITTTDSDSPTAPVPDPIANMEEAEEIYKRVDESGQEGGRHMDLASLQRALARLKEFKGRLRDPSQQHRMDQIIQEVNSSISALED